MRRPPMAVTLGVAAFLGLCSATVAASVTAGPSEATGNHGCPPVEVEPKLSDGVITTGGKGKGKVVVNVVQMETPVGDTEETKYSSWVRWTVNPDDDFQLKNLMALQYKTFIISDGDRGFAAPAVRLVLSNGVTLVYEPYWNGNLSLGDHADWQTWDALHNADWWDSPGPAEPAGGMVGAPTGTDTFEKWVAQMGDAKVLEINLGMGTWNEGAKAKFKGLTFKYKRKCESPSPSPSTSAPTTAPATTAPATEPPTTAPTTAPAPGQTTSAPGDGGGLPVTGPGAGLAGLGLLLAGGATLIATWWWRRRNNRTYVAE